MSNTDFFGLFSSLNFLLETGSTTELPCLRYLPSPTTLWEEVLQPPALNRSISHNSSKKRQIKRKTCLQNYWKTFIILKLKCVHLIKKTKAICWCHNLIPISSEPDKLLYNFQYSLKLDDIWILSNQSFIKQHLDLNVVWAEKTIVSSRKYKDQTIPQDEQLNL